MVPTIMHVSHSNIHVQSIIQVKLSEGDHLTHHALAIAVAE